MCQFCMKDLSLYNSTRKTQHLNRCMDKVINVFRWLKFLFSTCLWLKYNQEVSLFPPTHEKKFFHFGTIYLYKYNKSIPWDYYCINIDDLENLMKVERLSYGIFYIITIALIFSSSFKIQNISFLTNDIFFFFFIIYILT